MGAAWREDPLLGSLHACGPRSPGKGLSTGPNGGHSLRRFGARLALAPQPSWPPLAAAHNGCPCSWTQPWPLCILPRSTSWKMLAGGGACMTRTWRESRLASSAAAPAPSLPPVPSPGPAAGAQTTAKAWWFGCYHYLPH